MQAGSREAWLWILCGVAVVIGLLVGRWIHAVGTVPNLAAMFAMVAWMVFVAGLVVLVVVGLALMAFGQQGPGGAVMLVAASMGLGAFIAYMYGDGIQIVSERTAQIEVTLGPPIERSYIGSGTCFTVANGDAIKRVEGEPFMTAATTRLAVSLILDDGPRPHHRVAIVPDDPTGRMARYLSGVVSNVEVEAAVDRSTGSMAFTDLQADPQRELIGGADGPVRLDGTVTWSCDD